MFSGGINRNRSIRINSVICFAQKYFRVFTGTAIVSMLENGCRLSSDRLDYAEDLLRPPIDKERMIIYAVGTIL